MMKRIVFFLFFVCMASLCYPYQEVLHTGTLIVTYQTDAQGKKIELIRFWLKDKNKKQRLYPIGSGYVDDPRNFSRMVGPGLKYLVKPKLNSDNSNLLKLRFLG